MKFLFVVPPFRGHVLPTVSVARVLESRGHRVAWVGYPNVRPMLAEGAELIELGSAPRVHLNEKRGFEGLKYFYEDIVIPHARETLPGVAAAIDEYAPDVVVVDQQTVAGALAARRKGVKWVTFCTTSVAAADPLVIFAAAKRWLTDLMAQLESEAGLPASPEPDISPHLVVVFSTPELAGPDRAWPSQYRFVGPATQDRPDTTPFPWDELGPRPRVFVSLGTAGTPTESDRVFYKAAVEALRTLDGQVIVVAPPTLISDAPPTFLVRERVPQLALLPQVDAVVCHAGHNTVCESLANGLPLVVAPMRHDQPMVADLVVRAGAGLLVRYGRVTPAKLRAAVDSILQDGSFRQAASRIRTSFEAAGGAPAAADALEAVA